MLSVQEVAVIICRLNKSLWWELPDIYHKEATKNFKNRTILQFLSQRRSHGHDECYYCVEWTVSGLKFTFYQSTIFLSNHLNLSLQHAGVIPKLHIVSPCFLDKKVSAEYQTTFLYCLFTLNWKFLCYLQIQRGEVFFSSCSCWLDICLAKISGIWSIITQNFILALRRPLNRTKSSELRVLSLKKYSQSHKFTEKLKAPSLLYGCIVSCTNLLVFTSMIGWWATDLFG